MKIAYIGLGSNLDEPVEQIRTAVIALNGIKNSRLLQVSSLYASKPMGPQDQPDYINAVAEMETGLMPDALLSALQTIETRHGRQRSRHWGPRTLDLDLLLFADELMQTETLTIPHPGLQQREFVLFPLLEIAPEIVIPGVGSAAECAKSLDADSLRKVVD